ncbi:hypothetical protein [Flammeovirga sp. SJP92]|uniref:hypothetical protein n=1 Tax=Flammeovirga sp. SJP92 TaxID=1775430 RepID=UPI0007871698|nr:hypothetical protein [Flammeovirga sp. SJP92]KXX70864.1 hypothetical protein AVL50_10855 [Flammeovirga sp. SJP92]
MDRLNYFNPYQSKGINHEDQLTRAYLVLLKYSGHAFSTFFEYCRINHCTSEDEKSISLIENLEYGWDIQTQKSNPDISTSTLLSILITDSQSALRDKDIKSSERNAIYDGIITFGSNLTLIIENKPRSKNVWFDQLNPSRQNLSEETSVYTNPSILEWKEIIKQLNYLLSIPTLSGNEKIMIEDFLSFIDTNFPYLNPYDKFHQCKGNKELINRRIKNVLESIVHDESMIEYHRGWGFYIKSKYNEIKKIGLIQKSSDNDWHLELSLFFGDTQSQAKSFFSSFSNITPQIDNEWYIRPNFHVSFRNSNLVWFKSTDYSQYIDYWKNNIDKISQQKRDNVKTYISELEKQEIIILNEEKYSELEEKFYETAMSTLNMCPGLGMIYKLSSQKVEELDKNEMLKSTLIKRIKQALGIINKNGSEMLKE